MESDEGSLEKFFLLDVIGRHLSIDCFQPLLGFLDDSFQADLEYFFIIGNSEFRPMRPEKGPFIFPVFQQISLVWVRLRRNEQSGRSHGGS